MEIRNNIPDQGGLTEVRYVVAHETANPKSTMDNEIAFMESNWRSAFVSNFVGDGGREVQVHRPGRLQWGAGPRVNKYAYAQVELCEDKLDPTKFKKNYVAYVNLLRSLAKEAGLPLKLDEGYGIVTHAWVSNNLGGTDHNDPYPFLAKMGISKAQFKHDVENGVGSVPETPSQPTPPSTGIGTGMVNKTTYQKVDGNGTRIRVAQTTDSAILKEVNAGYTFRSDRYANGQNVDGKGYKWFEDTEHGGGWIYGGLITSTSAPQSVPQISVDGWWGSATTKRLQQVYGTYVDGVLSHQWKSSANSRIVSAQFDSTLIGSTLIKAIQKALGLKADGLCGADTIKAMQRVAGTPTDGTISAGSTLVKYIQRKLNAGQKPF